MSETMTKKQFIVEEVVRLNNDLAGVQVLDGSHVLKEDLGAGVIREVQPDGEILVHWVEADLDAWVQPEDIELFDPAPRILAIYERDGDQGRIFRRYKLVSRVGLIHSWAVELFPDNVIRTIRSDGSAWTFTWYPLLERTYPIHTLQDEPPTDDAAEALTVAELVHAS